MNYIDKHLKTIDEEKGLVTIKTVIFGREQEISVSVNDIEKYLRYLENNIRKALESFDGIVLNEGEIVGDGTHKDLYENCNVYGSCKFGVIAVIGVIIP